MVTAILTSRRKMYTSMVGPTYPLGTQRCCDVESTSLTLIQRRNNVVCPVGRYDHRSM